MLDLSTETAPLHYDIHLLESERKARQAAEQLLEEKSRALYLANQLVYRLSQMAAETASFEQALQTSVNVICQTIGWPVGHVYLYEKDDALRPADIWYLADPKRLSRLRETTMETYLKKGVGLPGRVFEQNTLIWIEDVKDDPNFLRNGVFSDLGVKGALGLPIRIEDNVVAILEFFTYEQIRPEQQILETMQSVSEQLSRVLERSEYQKSLKLANEILEMKVQIRTEELTSLNQKLESELSERRRLEGQLVQSEKMASLGQLAAGIAHEINNPIGFVMSNLSTLGEYLEILRTLLNYYEAYIAENTQSARQGAKQLATLQAYQQQEDIGFILGDLDQLLGESREGIIRVKEIVQNLKSFSRVDEGERKEANVNECLDTTLKIVWNELKYKCQVHKDYGELPMIPCYPGQLNQVFMNLFLNAAQAIAEQGNISITTRAGADRIEVTIADTGKGIPEAQLSQIFDPFFTTKPVGSGTGLGLSIVYGIIQKHGGDIQVSSEVGRGTTFRLTLPIEGVSS